MQVNGISKNPAVNFKAQLNMTPYKANTVGMEGFWKEADKTIRLDKRYDNLYVRAVHPSGDFSSDGVDFTIKASKGTGKKEKSSKEQTLTVALNDRGNSMINLNKAIEELVAQIPKGLFGR